MDSRIRISEKVGVNSTRSYFHFVNGKTLLSLPFFRSPKSRSFIWTTVAVRIKITDLLEACRPPKTLLILAHVFLKDILVFILLLLLESDLLGLLGCSTNGYFGGISFVT